MDLHPATVHFPIALLVASFLFDLVGFVAKDETFRRAGLYCLLLAAMGAGASYWTGVLAEPRAAQIPHIEDALARHEQAGILTLVFIGALVIGRLILEGRPLLRRVGNLLYLLAALVAVVNVLRTGYLGSELVQRFGAGVEPVMRRLQKTPAPPPPPPPLPPSTPAQ
ncbi:MAG: DUF2231 domain-containing protein [Armatimonadota bacterium]|nr:MAG: hypothetical protein KatS3mg024_1377 [Armatimonadota bacterium]